MSSTSSPPSPQAPAGAAKPGESLGVTLKTYIFSLVGIGIMFGFGTLAPIEPITPQGMKVLGIFLGVIFLWSFVDILWSSLLGIVALVMVGFAPLPRVMHMSFGDVVPCLILFAMILFGAIQHAGVTRYISRFFLTRKIINGRPTVFSFVFIYTTYILAALSANILPALLFMWAILYEILKELGYKKGDKYTAIMVIGTLFGGILGQAAKPFTGSALMIMGAYEKVAGANIDYLRYMSFGVLLCTIGVLLYALLIKFVFRPDMSKVAGISIEHFKRDPLPPMSGLQKLMMAVLFGFFILILAPSVLPKSIPVVAVLAKIGPLGIAILFVAALCLLRVGGRPALNIKEIGGKYIVWDVYFLVAMAMAVSSAMTAPGMGITDFLSQKLSPVLGGHSYVVFLALAVIFGVCITQFANNGVMGVLLMPVLKIFTEETGGDFEATATLLTFALHIAILTPAASPYAALIYGNKEWVSGGEIFKYGIVLVLLAMLLYTVFGIPAALCIF